MAASGIVIGALVLLGAAPTLGDSGLPKGWEPMTFKKIEKHTAYDWSKQQKAIHARSDDSASGLIRRIDGSAFERPVLRWRWKVSGVLEKGDARKKSGDDYPARLYVTFQYDKKKAGLRMRSKYALAKALYGEYPPHAGINYIWANKLPRGESINNAYTDRVRMVAVRSGSEDAGRWVSEERDILKDYRRLFGEDPPPLAGIAVMTDTDNTGEKAEAWFSDITLSPRGYRP